MMVSADDSAKAEDYEPLFGLYFHWPFCTKICPYCDFNVYAAKARDNRPLISAMKADLTAHRKLTGDRKVTSIYFGGGTPSLVTPADLSGFLNQISDLWPVHEHLEITLEANPEDVTPEALKLWKSVGITRISLGVQALNDDALRFLGRAHTKAQAMIAIEQSLAVFPNTSIDMIYARPGQSEADWLTELDLALKTGAPHLSLYELTIKEKTAFARQVERAVFTPLDEDAQADLYLATLKLTSHAGLPAYEVSNHAGNSAFWSKHNLTYWLGGDWLGIGPGAEGRFDMPDTGRLMTRAHKRPADYIAGVEAGGTGWAQSERLSDTDNANERLIMGLRSGLGVSVSKLEDLYGQRLPASEIARFREAGHLVVDKGRLKLTEEGWLLADYISASLSPQAN